VVLGDISAELELAFFVQEAFVEYAEFVLEPLGQLAGAELDVDLVLQKEEELESV
jgi:hypothetical protein